MTQVIAQQLANGLTLGCMYVLLALGYTLVFGIIRVIFFAQGEISMIGAFVAWLCMSLIVRWQWGQNMPLLAIGIALCLSIASSAVVSVAAERVALRPIRQAHRTKQLIASLGISIVIQNVVFLSATSESKPFPSPVPSAPYHLFGVTFIPPAAPIPPAGSAVPPAAGGTSGGGQPRLFGVALP